MNLARNCNTKIGDIEFFGTQVITPEIAEEMLKHNFVNRKINKNRVKGYAHDMKLLRWEKIVDGLAIQFDTDWNLLNGQHRLEAIRLSGIPQEMFIFKKNITANALSLPFDTGATRSLALLTKKTSNYIAMITCIMENSLPLNRCTPAMLSKFENSLTDEEMEVLEKIAYVNVKGFSAGIKVGFFLYYLQNKDKKEEILNLWNSSYTQDYENPKANAIRDFVSKRRAYGGGNSIRRQNLVQLYGILNDCHINTYRSDSYRQKTLELLSEWGKDRF